MKLDCHLVHLFLDYCFSLSGPATGCSPAASIWCGLTAPSSALLAPPVSSPCPNANRGIGHLAIGSSDWLTLWLPWTNETWKGESTKV